MTLTKIQIPANTNLGDLCDALARIGLAPMLSDETILTFDKPQVQEAPDHYCTAAGCTRPGTHSASLCGSRRWYCREHYIRCVETAP